jgi:hypothetical protein
LRITEAAVSSTRRRPPLRRLEHEDGTPPDPPTFRPAVPNWRAGDVIPLGGRSLRVVEVRDDDADQAPTLVVESLRVVGLRDDDADQAPTLVIEDVP